MADTDLIVYQDQGTVTKVKLFETGDGEYSHQPLDTSTWAVKTVDYEHHEIHAGNHYFVTDFTTLASDGVFAMGVVVPDTAEWPHLTFSYRTIGQATLEIFEAATFTSSDWTAVTAQNSNRNSANTSVLTVVSNTTFDSTAGTRIYGMSLGDGTNPSNLEGGQMRHNRDIILKQNTQYVFKISSETAGNIISYSADWYEHADKA